MSLTRLEHRSVRPLAAVLWIAVSGAALWQVADGQYSVGLDFEGGAHLELAPLPGGSSGCNPHVIEDRLHARHPETEFQLRAHANVCTLSFPGLTDESTLDAIATTLTGARFGLHPPRDARAWLASAGLSLPPALQFAELSPSPRPPGIVVSEQEAPLRAWIEDPAVQSRVPADGLLVPGSQPQSGPWQALLVAREPIVVGEDLQVIELSEQHSDQVTMVLHDAAARRFADYTREHPREALPVVLDGRMVMAPVLMMPIEHGELQLSLGTNVHAGELFKQLRAAQLGPVQVEDRFVIVSMLPRELGRPTALAICVAAVLLWGANLWLRSRRLAVVAVVVATAAAGVAFLLALGSTLSLAVYLAGLWFAPSIGMLMATATSERLLARLRHGWWVWLGFVSFMVIAVLIETIEVRPGLQWLRVGARFAASFSISAAVLGLLAVLTPAARTSRSTLSAGR